MSVKSVAGKRFQRLCTDIGTLFPNSMVVTFKFPFRIQPEFSKTDLSLPYNGGASNNWWTYYNQTYTMYPYQPLALFSNASANAPVDAPSSSPVGWTRLMGAAGAGTSALYQHCCVLKAEYQVQISLVCLVGATGTLAANIPVGTVPGCHLHLRSHQTETSPVILDTLAHLETQRASVNCLGEKLVGAPQGYGNYISGASTNMVLPLPGQTIKWKGVCYPHLDAKQTFRDYVSDSKSYGTSTGLPTQYSYRFCQGQMPDVTNTTSAGFAPNYGIVHGIIEFTCLLKDMVGTLS